MSDHPDPFDLLASMAAADRDGASLDRPLEPGDVERAELLLRRITSTPRATRTPTPTVRRLTRPRHLAAAAMAAAVVGVGAVVAAVWSKQPADPATVLCYSSVDVEPAAIVGLVAEPGVDPTMSCAAPWTDGRLGSGPAPGLVACVNDRDTTVVLPGDATACERLGWPIADLRVTADAHVAVRVTREVPGVLAECLSDLDAGRSAVEQLLSDLGADGWTVEVATAPAPAGRSCVAASVQATSRVVTLVFVTPPDG
jgi:hypothetical protein